MRPTHRSVADPEDASLLLDVEDERYAKLGETRLFLRELRRVQWVVWAVLLVMVFVLLQLWSTGPARLQASQLAAATARAPLGTPFQAEAETAVTAATAVRPVSNAGGPPAVAVAVTEDPIRYLAPENCTVNLADLRSAKVKVTREEAERNSVSAAFGDVYRKNVWTEAGGGSGSGSTLPVTENIRAVLRAVALKHHVRTMVDAPCGALVWMPTVLESIEEDARPDTLNYYGVDAAVDVIDGVSTRLAAHENWSFHTLDLSSAVFCDPAIDLLFSRDALQHLACPLIVNVLHNFAFSSARLLLVGSYPNGRNRNIQTGDYFSINLRAAPFNLVPLQVFNEWTTRVSKTGEPDKQALLIDVPSMRKLDFAAMKEGCKTL